MLEVIKNPLIIALIIFIIMLVSQYLRYRNTNDVKSKMNYTVPLIVSLLVWIISHQLINYGVITFGENYTPIEPVVMTGGNSIYDNINFSNEDAYSIFA